jgi:hypothetical protein
LAEMPAAVPLRMALLLLLLLLLLLHGPLC